tara:strand:- start:790 stop:1782 length:993 start_codon:yes stop_codon:yes gene_type:complete
MYTKRRLIKSLVGFFFIIFYKINLFAKTNFKHTLVLTNNIFSRHLNPKNHPETPERFNKIIQILKKSRLDSLIQNIELENKSEEWINKIHSQKHIQNIKENEPLGHILSSAAAEICMRGVDLILHKKTKNVFCAVRPPGHHALNTGKQEGFCYYNHVAVATKYIQKTYNIKKILIVDWDYHHGNSTEYFFYDDPSVLFFSTHDQFAYPGTGLPSRTGSKQGRGFNINVHLPCETTDDEIIETFKTILVPKAEAFKPDFVIISAGFDSRTNDLLGCYNITDEGFKKLTQIVMNISNKFCEGKLMSVLEGGYNLEGNASASLAHIKELNNYI